MRDTDLRPSPGSRAALVLAWLLLISSSLACGPDRSDRPQSISKPEGTALPDVVRPDPGDRDELHRAAIANDVQGLRAALAAGAELDARDESGRTALHLAVEKGRHEALRHLIGAGADTALPLPDGSAPLACAVMRDDLAAAEALFFCDRNRDLALTEGSANRSLAIHAVKHKRYALAEMFLYPLHYLVKRGLAEHLPHLLAVERRLLGQKDEKGMTPLHNAYLYRDRRFIELLSAAGADQEAHDVYGKKPAEYDQVPFAATTEVDALDPETRIRIDDRMLDFFMHHDWMTIGVVKDGRIAFLKTYGPRDMIDQDAVHASVSKPMTCVVFLRLWHNGVFKSLDDDIGLYSKKYRNVLPAAYAGETITFRRLLTHRSGIPHLDKPLWLDGKLNLQFRPGARFGYTTNGFSVLGEIMSEVTGRSFSDLVKEHIGGPVGASSFWAEDHFRAPGARIHSTPRDFARFAKGIVDNSYLSEKEFDEVLVGTQSEESLGWGAGYIGTPDLTLGHSGSNGRPRSHLLIKPKKKLALVLMGETKTRDSDIWFLHLAPILLDILEGKGGY